MNQALDLSTLALNLARHYPAWRARDLALIGQGTEAYVYRAETDTFGAVAIKVPRARCVPSSSGPVDYRKYMRQEAALAGHAARYGVPTLSVHALHFASDGGPDYLVAPFVASDGTPPHDAEFGRLLRAIHACPPTDIPLGVEDGADVHDIVANRLTQRARALEAVADIALPRLQRESVSAWLRAYRPRRALLHMDARPANLFTHERHIITIADWTNALWGDPALELARAEESGVATPEFLAGYGEAAPFAHLPPPVETLYRLDTTVMLARLFLAELHELELGQKMVVRTLNLHAALPA